MVAKKYNIDVLLGQTFNRITITGEINIPRKDRQFTYKCICGNEGAATPFHIVNGVVKSCGCLHKELASANGKKSKTHGMTNTRPFRIWMGMKTRCDNTKVQEYPDYGGRGITYCDKWKTFEGFWEDMQEGYSDHLTLDRVDTNGNYGKNNCSWENMSVQSHHRRSRKGSSSDYVGVFARKVGFEAVFCKDGIVKYLGKFPTELLAAIAYDDAYEEVYGVRNNKTKGNK